MKVPPFRGLRTRLMLLMLLAALPAFVAIGYLAHDQQRHFADLYRKNNQTLANILASEHEQNFEQARLLLATLAYHPDIAAADGCQALVTTVAAKAPGHIANLFNVAPDGRIRCSAAGPTGHFNVADMAWFRGALAATGARVGEYHISRRSGQPTIVVTHTLRREGRVTAVLAAALDLSWLTSQISLARLPHGAAYGIFDNRGNHLLRHRHLPVSRHTTSPTPRCGASSRNSTGRPPSPPRTRRAPRACSPTPPWARPANPLPTCWWVCQPTWRRPARGTSSVSRCSP